MVNKEKQFYHTKNNIKLLSYHNKNRIILNGKEKKIFEFSKTVSKNDTNMTAYYFH